MERQTERKVLVESDSNRVWKESSRVGGTQTSFQRIPQIALSALVFYRCRLVLIGIVYLVTKKRLFSDPPKDMRRRALLNIPLPSIDQNPFAH